MGVEKRHHGRRLARNVDTGTVAAMVAAGGCSPGADDAAHRFPTHASEHGCGQVEG